MMKQSVISARNLSIGYPKNGKRGKTVLHENFSFDLYAGELTCLLGANGSGKSTLLRTLTRLQCPLSGKILVNNRELSTYSEQQLSTLLGLVLTDKTTAGGFTVSELIGLGRYPYTGFFGKFSQKDHELVNQAMQSVNISHKANAYVAELSDGEKQKVMIAKALAQECPIIILDEPTAYLDVINRIEIMNLLHDLATKQNKTILLSTHDIELTLSLADRSWLLDKDKGLKCGATEDLIFKDEINNYLGDSNIIFDIESGRFISKLKEGKPIYMEAEDGIYYWAENFLSRNGYVVSTNMDASLYISITSPNFIFIRKEKETALLNSFEELRSWLKLNYS